MHIQSGSLTQLPLSQMGPIMNKKWNYSLKKLHNIWNMGTERHKTTKFEIELWDEGRKVSVAWVKRSGRWYVRIGTHSMCQASLGGTNGYNQRKWQVCASFRYSERVVMLRKCTGTCIDRVTFSEITKSRRSVPTFNGIDMFRIGSVSKAHLIPSGLSKSRLL